MKFYRKLLFILLSVFSLSFMAGCANNPDDNVFYVDHQGAKMPVWVKGNTASQTFLFIVHGGPGSGSVFYHFMAPFQNLEKDYALVYWDQRNSGFTQGNPDLSTITMDQFVEDMHVVIQVLKSKYTITSLIVMGHSFGGQLGSEYMISAYKDPLVKGWIDVDGTDSWPTNYAYSRNWMLNKLPQKLADSSLDTQTRQLLQEALDWYNNTPLFYQSGDSMSSLSEKVARHAQYVTAAGGYEYNQGVMQKLQGSLPIFDPTLPTDWFSMLASNGAMLNYWFNEENRQSVLNDIDLSLIQVPTLFLWGAHDGILPLELGQFEFNSLTGVAPANKSMVIFDYSGHSPMLEEPDKFYSEVANFINQYK